MILSIISKDKWTVLAVAKDDGEVPLLEFLSDETKSKKAKENMLSTLVEYVPTHGTPKDENKCKYLRDHILEFKTGSNKGPKVRVLFFYDKGKVIVCSHGFLKDTQKTNPDEIDKAIQIRENYLEAQKNKKLTIKE